MSNINRGPSLDACYQASVDLAKRFQRRRFQKLTKQKQELPMVAMFVNGSGLNNQSLKRTFHRCFLPSFVHLVKRFQRRRFLEIDQPKTRMPVAAMFVNISQQNQQSLQRTFDRCCLPSFSSFGQEISEKKIQM